MEDQDAKDINQMMSAQPEVPLSVAPKKSRLLWVVLSCVVVGVGLGVVVYQQSIKPLPVTSTPRPTATAVTTIPSPVGSAAPAGVNQVTPMTMGVDFPKAGKLRVFYHNLIATNVINVIMKGGVTSTASLPIESGVSTMGKADTGYTLTAPANLKFDTYLGSNSTELAIGWTNPVGNKCGFNGFGQVDISSYVAYATTAAAGEPIVSVQCWADYSPTGPSDSSSLDFNDYLLIWTYTPPVGASASPSTAASANPSVSPSPSPSRSPSPSPSPTPSRSPSPSPTNYYASPTPTPSARAAMPDTSNGTPVTGVFEVTVGTMSVGLILLVLGLLGLLAL